MHIEVVEKLSLREQFRLIEIAHETKDYQLRVAAMTVLTRYLNPMCIMMAQEQKL